MSWNNRTSDQASSANGHPAYRANRGYVEIAQQEDGNFKVTTTDLQHRNEGLTSKLMRVAVKTLLRQGYNLRGKSVEYYIGAGMR